MYYRVKIEDYGEYPDIVRGVLCMLNKEGNNEVIFFEDEFEIETDLTLKQLDYYVKVLNEEHNAVLTFTKVKRDPLINEIKELLFHCPFGLSFEEIKLYFDNRQIKSEQLVKFRCNQENRYFLDVDSFLIEENRKISKKMNQVYKELLARKTKYTYGFIKSVIFFSKANNDFNNIITMITNSDDLTRFNIAQQLHDLKDKGVFVTERVAFFDINDNLHICNFVLDELYAAYNQRDDVERRILVDLLVALYLNLEYELSMNDTNLIKKLLNKTYMKLYEASEDTYYQRKMLTLIGE